MQITKTICDKCKKEIIGEPTKITITDVNTDDRDFCSECAEEIIYFMMGVKVEEKHIEKVFEPEMKKAKLTTEERQRLAKEHDLKAKEGPMNIMKAKAFV